MYYIHGLVFCLKYLLQFSMEGFYIFAGKNICIFWKQTLVKVNLQRPEYYHSLKLLNLFLVSIHLVSACNWNSNKNPFLTIQFVGPPFVHLAKPERWVHLSTAYNLLGTIRLLQWWRITKVVLHLGWHEPFVHPITTNPWNFKSRRN